MSYAYELAKKIERFGDRATGYNLDLTKNKSDIFKLIEYMMLQGIVSLDKSQRPAVYRVSAARIGEARKIKRIPTMADINKLREKAPAPVKSEPIRVKAKQPKKVKGTNPAKADYELKKPACAPGLPGKIVQMLAMHGELCVVRQLIPLLDGGYTEFQITQALKYLIRQGQVTRRISFRKIHGGCGSYAYKLVEGKIDFSPL